jgi:DNA-binding response OmpR family regulator
MSLTLRQKEFVLLELLMTHLGTVFSKTQIAERVWGSAYYVSDNTIEATISTLRQKLSDTFEGLDDYKLGKNDQIIETIRGAGYRFNFDLFKDHKDS